MDNELQHIFVNSPFAINFLDNEMSVLRINPAMETLIGFKSEEIRGRYCYDCWGQYAKDNTRHGTERICDVCVIPATLNDGKIPMKEGSEIKYLELEACPHMLKSPGNMKINTCQGDNDIYTKC